MSVPKLKRLAIEDFQDQEEWIGKLLDPINTFMEETVRALDRSLTFGQNFSADVRTILWDGSPQEYAWGLKSKPVAIWVGDVKDANNSNPTLDTAGANSVGIGYSVQWVFTQDASVRVAAIAGLNASNTNKFSVRLIGVTG